MTTDDQTLVDCIRTLVQDADDDTLTAVMMEALGADVESSTAVRWGRAMLLEVARELDDRGVACPSCGSDLGLNTDCSLCRLAAELLF